MSKRPKSEKLEHEDVNGTISTGKSEDVEATIECLPCQHTSGRTPFNRSHTLWASWCVASGGKKVWFGGDTGYRTVPELPTADHDSSEKYNFPHCPVYVYSLSKETLSRFTFEQRDKSGTEGSSTLSELCQRSDFSLEDATLTAQGL